MQETVEETTALADWRHRIGLCGLEEEAERIGRKMAVLGLRGDGTRDETRRGGGGEPKGVGHEVFREIKKQKPNTYPMA